MAEYPEDENDEPVKKKKKKDPNAPKKNLNAWMFFIQQVRPSVVAELGEDGKRVATVTKVVGDRWSKMTAEEKQVRFPIGEIRFQIEKLVGEIANFSI